MSVLHPGDLDDGYRKVSDVLAGTAHPPLTLEALKMAFTVETNEPQAGDPQQYPEGTYAIVELFGHQTIVGRINEVDRFGTKFMAIEPIYLGKLLAPVLQGGSSIYRCTPCSAEVAFNRGARETYHLPESIRATLPAHLLPAPADGDERDHRDDAEVDDDDELPL